MIKGVTMTKIETNIFMLGWLADKIENEPEYRSPMWGMEVQAMRDAKQLLEIYCLKHDDHQFTIDELINEGEPCESK